MVYWEHYIVEGWVVLSLIHRVEMASKLAKLNKVDKLTPDELLEGLVEGIENKVVLGKFPDYLTVADDLNAKRFNIPEEIWDQMTDTERWAANKKFLDRAISNNSEIILSNQVKNIEDVSGAFRRELDYLIEQGYKLSEDGLSMIKST